MARKSRKNTPIAVAEPTDNLTTKAVLSLDKEAKPYQVGIYARLSFESEANKERDTVDTQIAYIREFINGQDDMVEVCVYADISVTGTTFERPEFDRMIHDIRAGKINTVITRDLSRLGRNYVEAGNYIERVFPFLDVRYIAITDDFDTARPGTDLSVPFKNIVNEYYSKDLSKKVETGKHSIWAQGGFSEGTPPYGYYRATDGSRKLLIDEEVSDNVVRIFNMFLDGKGYAGIAKTLQYEGILSPPKYRFYKSGKIELAEKAREWHYSHVKEILQGEYYIGNIVHGKQRKALDTGRKNVKTDASTWQRIENVHEPIIDKDTFYKTRERMEHIKKKHLEASKPKADVPNKPDNILVYKTKCACCGGSVLIGRHHTYSEKFYYKCKNRRKLARLCENKYSYDYSEVMDSVFSVIRQHMSLCVEKTKFVQKMNSRKENVLQYDIYVLLNLREEILEVLLPNQYNKRQLSDELYITSKCFPFEQKPFLSNLAGKRTSKCNIAEIMEIVNDRHEVEKVLPYLKIEKLISETGELFFDKKIIASDEAIKKYNSGLDTWEQKNGFKINEKEGVVSIDSYESTTLFILQRLLELSHNSDREQQKSNEKYLRDCKIEFEDESKKIAMKYLFVSSQVMLIYGAAGTGKTTLIKYISQMMSQSKKLFLAKTYTALNNLQRRVCDEENNAQFASIDSIVKSSGIIDFDIIFVDECSTIDNRTMEKFLNKIKKETKLVFSGDIYQIESIDFGNWFYYAKDIIKTKGASIELLHNWRTDKKELSSLWDEVRKKSPIITEKLSMDGPFSKDLCEDIFQLTDGEVVLCLNYDGKFGLNNMNQYFQNANKKSEEFSWAEWIFKIGDRIIFLDTRRSSLLYNNLKGIIQNIEKTDSSIVFTIDIKTYLTEEQCKDESFEYVENNNNGTRIKLEVIAWDDELSEDDRIKTVIPFQIAYAISIHKAQGLEYESVKVVIPSSNAEKITHSIFYTAITRAKQKLKIFWSAETMDAIVKGFTEKKVESKTLQLIKERLKIQDE